MKLEDLFKIKQAEKPTEADWQKFDEQLRRKMLLAIIKREPFHKRVFSRFGILRKPAFAAALALPLLALPMLFTGAPRGGSHTEASTEIAVLPHGANSFATNELSNESSEKPLSVQMQFYDNSRISYATNTLSAGANFAF